MKLNEKKCKGKCGEIKPLEDFHKSQYNIDGRQSVCKNCWNEKRKQYHRDKAEERRMFI